MRLASELFRYF